MVNKLVFNSLKPLGSRVTTGSRVTAPLYNIMIFIIAEVMDQVAENVPPLESIVKEIEELAESGGKYNEAPHVIEVTLPMVCR